MTQYTFLLFVCYLVLLGLSAWAALTNFKEGSMAWALLFALLGTLVMVHLISRTT